MRLTLVFTGLLFALSLSSCDTMGPDGLAPGSDLKRSWEPTETFNAPGLPSAAPDETFNAPDAQPEESFNAAPNESFNAPGASDDGGVWNGPPTAEEVWDGPQTASE